MSFRTLTAEMMCNKMRFKESALIATNISHEKTKTNNELILLSKYGLCSQSLIQLISFTKTS